MYTYIHKFAISHDDDANEQERKWFSTCSDAEEHTKKSITNVLTTLRKNSLAYKRSAHTHKDFDDKGRIIVNEIQVVIHAESEVHTWTIKREGGSCDELLFECIGLH